MGQTKLPRDTGIGRTRRISQQLTMISLSGVLEAAFLAAVLSLFLYFLIASRGWPAASALLPTIVSVVGLTLWTLYVAKRLFIEAPHGQGQILDIGFRDAGIEGRLIARRILQFVGSIGMIVSGVWLVGYHITIPIYLFGYSVMFGKLDWRIALFLAIGAEVLLVGIYGALIHVQWNEPVLLKLIGVQIQPFTR